MFRRRLFAASIIIALRHADAWAQANFSEAVGTLARERSLAEEGVSLLKRYAPDDIDGRSLYAQAKAASDELIEQLLTDLAQQRDPEVSENLRTKVGQAVQRRLEFSRRVDAVMKRVVPPGARASWADALATGAADLVKEVIVGGVAIWREWRSASIERRREMATRLEAQRWRPFSDIEAAK